jgi:hypothetical protein
MYNNNVMCNNVEHYCGTDVIWRIGNTCVYGPWTTDHNLECEQIPVYCTFVSMDINLDLLNLVLNLLNLVLDLACI